MRALKCASSLLNFGHWCWIVVRLNGMKFRRTCVAAMNCPTPICALLQSVDSTYRMLTDDWNRWSIGQCEWNCDPVRSDSWNGPSGLLNYFFDSLAFAFSPRLCHD
jgi:hypothetical protein